MHTLDIRLTTEQMALVHEALARYQLFTQSHSSEPRYKKPGFIEELDNLVACSGPENYKYNEAVLFDWRL